MIRIKVSWSLVSLLLLYTASVSAQPIPALESVPEALPDPPRNSLRQRHAELASTRDSLRPRIADRDRRCQVYFKD